MYFLFPEIGGIGIYTQPFNGKVLGRGPVYLICELPAEPRDPVTFSVNGTKYITIRTGNGKCSHNGGVSDHYKISCDSNKLYLNITHISPYTEGWWSCRTKMGESNSVFIKDVSISKLSQRCVCVCVCVCVYVCVFVCTHARVCIRCVCVCSMCL